MGKIKWLVCAVAGLLMLSCAAEVQDTVGLTDDYFKVSITPENLTLLKDFDKCDAFVAECYWTRVNDWEDNADVAYTLELAKAGTNFKNSYYVSIGNTGKIIYTVKEFNELLIKNGLVENGAAADIEARINATLSSFKGVRSEPVSFRVQTYYIDMKLLPPYDRIWFVGSFTDWQLVEMKKNPDNAFQFYIDITLNDMSATDTRESTNEFKFAVSNKSESKWWDNYKAPYKDAPITETQAVQVHNDVVNDFKWKLVGDELNKSYHIVLDITPGQERMLCTLIGETPVDPPGGGDDPDPTPEPEPEPGPDPSPVPSPGVGSYVRKQYVTEMEYGCPGNEGSVKLEGGWIIGLNAWRTGGYIQMTLDDVPEDGYYYLISGLKCWKNTEWSYKVIYDETADLHIFTPELLNTLIEDRCTVYLKEGSNSIRIKAGDYKNDGYAPNFYYLIVSNGYANGPVAGGNDQGEY